MANEICQDIRSFSPKLLHNFPEVLVARRESEPLLPQGKSTWPPVHLTPEMERDRFPHAPSLQVTEYQLFSFKFVFFFFLKKGNKLLPESLG